jgi:hypothetical protein
MLITEHLTVADYTHSFVDFLHLKIGEVFVQLFNLTSPTPKGVGFLLNACSNELH